MKLPSNNVKEKKDEDCSIWNNNRGHARNRQWSAWLSASKNPSSPLFVSEFVCCYVIFLTPIITVVLLWTQFYRIGSWLLLSSIAGSLLFGIYNHFIVISPDHVSQISSQGWGLLFQVTAILILIVDGLGCGITVWALNPVPQKEKI